MMQTKMTKLSWIILIFGALTMIVLMFIPDSPEKRLWSPFFLIAFYGLALTEHVLYRKNKEFYRIGFWSLIIIIAFQFLSLYQALAYPY